MVTPAQSTDLREEILELKKQRNAVILAHNYQVGEIQDLADYVGDSLGLAYRAREAEADVIAFCGVHFMAETAKIINPDKTVVLPDKDAGCSLEESCPGDKLEAFLKENAEKNYYVVAYINCSAHVKALSDCICTSGNAVKIVEAAPADRPILFVPDQNLGSWVMEKTGRKMDLWQGSCYVHVEFTRDSIAKIREEHPGAELIAHPECTYAVRMLADVVCSTEKMVDYARRSEAENLIVANRGGDVAPPPKRGARQELHRRPDRSLRLFRMPFHEDEHARETARLPQGSQTGAGPPGGHPRPRRGADPAHAGAQQIAGRPGYL